MWQSPYSHTGSAARQTHQALRQAAAFDRCSRRGSVAHQVRQTLLRVGASGRCLHRGSAARRLQPEHRQQAAASGHCWRSGRVVPRQELQSLRFFPQSLRDLGLVEEPQVGNDVKSGLNIPMKHLGAGKNYLSAFSKKNKNLKRSCNLGQLQKDERSEEGFFSNKSPESKCSLRNLKLSLKKSI